jgi:hypothetical protein
MSQMAPEAKATLRALKMIAYSVRRFSLAAARIIFNSVVRPVLTYSVPVQYHGRKQDSLLDVLPKSQNTGVIWVLGAFKMSRIDEFNRTAFVNIPLIKYVCDKLHDNAAL